MGNKFLCPAILNKSTQSFDLLKQYKTRVIIVHHRPADLKNPHIHNPIVSAERAISEMRSGRAVIMTYEGMSQVVMSAECMASDHIALLNMLADEQAQKTSTHTMPYLILTRQRLKRLGVERTQHGAISLPELSLERITDLGLKVESRIDAPIYPTSTLDDAALALAQASQLVPAVVAMPISNDALTSSSFGLVCVSLSDLRIFTEHSVRDVQLISRAPVPLEQAPETEFCVFRGGEGLRDQVAIIVGKPDYSEGVLVRMHSACLTGDLFGSLKCDCGDQLRNTVKFMSDNGGGILLYLDQEGRGNGIANKMRAYALQAKGYDTYDADEVFGFGADQRHFEFAANMLVQLGVQKVRLMTNNPIKIAAIEKAGLTLVDNQRVLGRLTTENVAYLKSKRDNAGHIISADYLSHKPAIL